MAATIKAAGGAHLVTVNYACLSREALLRVSRGEAVRRATLILVEALLGKVERELSERANARASVQRILCSKRSA